MTAPTLGSLADAEIHRRCFEDSTDGIVVTDLDGRIVRVNRAWLALFGFTEAEALGRTTRLVRSELTGAEVYAEMWARIRDPAQGFWKGELVNRHRDGTEIPVLVTITPVRDGERLVGYIGVTLDLRERKALDELKRLYELVLWHDLKAPLGAIRSLLEAVLAGLAGPLSDRQLDLLGRANRQATRMGELIATTLDLERLKQRKLELEVADLDLSVAAREALSTLAERAQTLGVEVALEAEPVSARGDALHLQRCVENLLKNAIEAAPRGSRVGVRVRAEGGEARLAVHNPGAPIPAEVRATLFHPFGTYGKKGGSGLGLYGVKLLVEAMGGSVGYESGAAGTTFELRLPLRA